MADREVADRQKEVVIFGAGIAGLTAAHELIERGFRVEVYELAPPSILEQIDGYDCGIGGKARTQWSRTERPTPGWQTVMTSTQPIADDVVNLRLVKAGYDQHTGEFTEQGRGALKSVADVLGRNPQVRCVEIRGYCSDRLALPFGRSKTDPPETQVRGAADGNDRIDRRMAVKAAEELAAVAAPGFKLADGSTSTHDGARTLRPVAFGFGCADDWSAPPHERSYVTFHVVEDLIPGEHGFRFFPAFYRNLYDTLTRIPIADAGIAFTETGRTVRDNVIPTKRQRVELNAKRAFEFPRRTPRSLQEQFELLVKGMKSLGYTLDDVAQFELKLFKYMSSCAERRESEYENTSWWQFIEGDRLSERFGGYIDSTGQTLVAMRSRECDARTYGNVSVQMTLDQFSDGGRTDGTLNGPTSLAWLEHWRRYLVVQGVEFRRGELLDLRVVGDAIFPLVLVAPDNETFSEHPEENVKMLIARDYVVVALPENAIRRMIARNPDLRGRGGDFAAMQDLSVDEGGADLADMSGIQFYFDRDIRFVEGHIDYADAEWGLSSISQPQFWEQRRGWWSGYRGVLSVDICNWHTPSKVTKRCAWDSTKEEIAAEVWRQIEATLPDSLDAPTPILYHLDDNIKFTRDDPSGRKDADGNLLQVPGRNATPFLVNRPGRFRRRPGRLAGLDGYELQFESLVFAGPHMKTHTRMTTMEAANESARHAVNAILTRENWKAGRAAIFDPEASELADLRFLTELDRRLHALGLPHLVDILDLRSVPPALLQAEPNLESLGLTLTEAIRDAVRRA